MAHAVRRLDPDLSITVADSHGDHLFQPGLVRMPLRGETVRFSADTRRLLRPDVQLIVERAAALDLGRREVRFQSGAREPFDALVLATGSRLHHDGIPGAYETAHHFHCRRAALRLGDALRSFEGGRIVIGLAKGPIRFPLAPAEFALLLEDWLSKRGRRSQVELECFFPSQDDDPDPSSPGPLRTLLESRRIRVRSGFRAAWVDASRRVIKSDDSEIPFDLLVLVPPHVPQPYLRDSGLLDASGWVRVDPRSLRVADRIYALGDTANLSAPKLGSAARRQATIVARNVVSELRGEVPDAVLDGHARCILAVGGWRGSAARFAGLSPVRLGRPSFLQGCAKELLGRLYFNLIRRG